MLQNLLALCQITQRTMSTTSHRQFEHKVPGKQKLFEEGNGIPVHLKSGMPSIEGTMILRVDGMAYAIYRLTLTSFPKKQD